ncbi:tetratricopeptide repeat-containing sulfotransferase family protein [Brevundimonas sp.]|jgi:tetratricopeptide (TPR) repeat protein|uniref:tetratricopeptide repeat-containing sulfotransferase family protein n=1 Tax=Brevundimonas sp. TaxID=1871086 RepID=UPI00181596BC|nr:tetratricopeptide repeat-containing sulfotransferase family protein [Brevundimonas sp.]MBA4809288.1 sulfotransferase [Brevundimonas sp.]
MESVAAPDIRLAQAATLERADRIPEAVQAYQAVLAERPGLGDAWYDLGRLLRRMRRLDEALSAYGQALAQGGRSPEEIHLNRGVIFADDLSRPAEAEAELKRALEIAPAYASAWLNLGNLHEDGGRRDEARVAYEAALALEPNNTMALARLAGLQAVVTTDEPLIDRLRTALAASSDDRVLKRADLGFALGRLLDAAGVHDEAFAAYIEANRASAAVARSRGLSYDPVLAGQYVDRLIAATPAPVAPLDDDDDGAPPIFICGMFRSGSTLVERLLAGHSGVRPGGELDLLPTLAANVFNPFPEALEAFDDASRRKIRDVYLTAVRERVPGVGRVTDKRPDNILYIGLAKTLFPRARIIHTVRDPIDNALSVFFLHLSHTMLYALDLEHAAHWAAQERRLAAHWKSVWPDDVYEVDYDDLVARGEPAVRELVEACGLDLEPSVMDFNQRQEPVRTASVWQVREPLYRRSSGRWKNYAPHLDDLRAALARYGLEG